MTAILRAVCADITDLDVGCVINAASTTPLGGGSVDGAIHDAAAPELFDVWSLLFGCIAADKPRVEKIIGCARLSAKS